MVALVDFHQLFEKESQLEQQETDRPAFYNQSSPFSELIIARLCLRLPCFLSKHAKEMDLFYPFKPRVMVRIAPGGSGGRHSN